MNLFESYMLGTYLASVQISWQNITHAWRPQEASVTLDLIAVIVNVGI
jgi:hypothetical protein